jgi:hypothetical protein
VPRAVAELGRAIAADAANGQHDVKISVVEIYCERIRDLLSPAGTGDNLKVCQDAAQGVYIEGATQQPVTSGSQLVDTVGLGLAQRAVSATAMNEVSSRSHCVVQIIVQRLSPDGILQQGKLCMVDLAGSERQDKSLASGSALTEGSQINKSLSCLAKVINALTDDKIKHVPYRDSKLTRVLQDSLGGTAKTVLIICCSPAAENAAETLSTLRFGSRAKGVSNAVQVNQKLDVKQMQAQLAATELKCQDLQEQLEGLCKQAHELELSRDAATAALASMRASAADAPAHSASASSRWLRVVLCTSTLVAYFLLQDLLVAHGPC